VKRYYIGVDWGDRLHQVYVGDEEGKKVKEIKVKETVEGLAEIGRWLDEKRAEGFELWAGIEKPAGRIVDFLLDHGMRVFPVNPKTLDRVRDRYRMSNSKSDGFDAYVLAEFVRTDHAHFRALEPSSPKAQELKLLWRDQRRVIRHKTRLLNQLTTTLKEYYPRPLEAFGNVETEIALDFLTRYPTPADLAALKRKEFNRFATQEHHLSKERCEQLWNKLQGAQLPVPEYVVRTKAEWVRVLIEQLRPAIKAAKSYAHKVESFFDSSPAAKIARTLPGAKSGTLIAGLWAELGDAAGRWDPFAIFRPRPEWCRSPRLVARVALFSSVSLVINIYATRCTGFRLSRLTTVSGPRSTTASSAPKDMIILKLCEHWVPSGLRSSL
jgi:hypothetical protein